MNGIVLALLVMLVPSLAVGGGLSDGGKPVARDSGPAGDEAQIALIKKLEGDRLEAGLRKDIDAISLATAEDYIQIDSEGNILSRRSRNPTGRSTVRRS